MKTDDTKINPPKSRNKSLWLFLSGERCITPKQYQHQDDAWDQQNINHHFSCRSNLSHFQIADQTISISVDIRAFKNPLPQQEGSNGGISF
jgi:hypothetical protein